jgi:hypothetical protein
LRVDTGGCSRWAPGSLRLHVKIHRARNMCGRRLQFWLRLGLGLALVLRLEFLARCFAGGFC